MRMRWRGFELPSRVIRDEAVSTDSYGRFMIEPFEQGFGATIGNSLRRVLLSSLDGAAITTVKIDGVSHEFTSIDGVVEDVTDILLNIKGIVLKLDGDGPKKISIQRETTGEVHAGDIVTDPSVTIVNTGHVIATLTADVNFHAEMTVNKARGYRTGSDNRSPDQELGVIPVDSIFSPVLRVRFRTEDMRVGQRTNYDRLILEIWTNGTVTPEDALVEAGLILRKHLNPFVNYYELGDELVSSQAPPIEMPCPEDSAMAELLDKPVSILNLSVRASNCLEAAKIATLRQLMDCSESDLLRFRSFGKTSLHEVQRKLAGIGLSLGLNPDEDTGSTNGDAAPGTMTPEPTGTDKEAPDSADGSSVPTGAGPMEAYTMED